MLQYKLVLEKIDDEGVTNSMLPLYPEKVEATLSIDTKIIDMLWCLLGLMQVMGWQTNNWFKKLEELED